jgi:signal transduction histidine kinase
VRIALKTKISVTLVGTLVLAVLGSAIALLSAWRSREIAEALVSGSLADARAVAQLEISLLEQRGFVSSYVLDGDRKWLHELDRREPSFAKWLEHVRRLPRTPDEHRTVAKLDEVFGEYDRRRREAVELYDRGDKKAAHMLFLTKVNPLYNRAYVLCEELVAATRKRTQAAVAQGRRDFRSVSVLVLACVAATIVLGSALLWLFFRGVLLPLRRMADDARLFHGPGEPSWGASSPRDELRAIGLHLQTLTTDIRQARSQLLNAEKLASVGKLAACVAHEIRNPLTSLRMRLFSVTREVGNDPLYEEDLRVMSEETARLDNVVRNFLEFAKPPELRPQPTSVTLVLDKTLELIQHRLVEKDIKLAREGESRLPEMMADPQQMKQVFVNLLLNAADATRERGTVRLVSSTARDGDGRGMVVVKIRDTGTGIPQDARDRVFEPFFSLKEESTGLGLCIAARILAGHGGKLVLESSTPGGTVFAVWVPAAATEGRDEQHPDR